MREFGGAILIARGFGGFWRKLSLNFGGAILIARGFDGFKKIKRKNGDKNLKAIKFL